MDHFLKKDMPISVIPAVKFDITIYLLLQKSMIYSATLENMQEMKSAQWINYNIIHNIIYLIPWSLLYDSLEKYTLIFSLFILQYQGCFLRYVLLESRLNPLSLCKWVNIFMNLHAAGLQNL